MPKSFLNMPGLPLGLRDNNPGNLRASSDQWQGMIGTNKGFVVFKDCSYGLRALGIDLRSKISKGYNTLEKIIYRYVPPSENDTEAYLDYMIGATLFSRSQLLTADAGTLKKLMRGIMDVELGRDYSLMLSDADINEGIAMMSGGGVSTQTAAIGFGGSVLLFLGVLYYVTRPIKPKRS